MNPSIGAILVLAVAVIAWVLTRLILTRAGSFGLFKPPNERSSHTISTPQGGGVAIAFAGILGSAVVSLTSQENILVMAVCGGLIALLGFIDDLRDLSPFARFPIQIGLVFAVVLAFLPLPPVWLPAGVALEGWVLLVLLVLAGVWWVNLFNFMDGVDGIAASQTILILLVAAMLWLFQDRGALSEAMFWVMMSAVGATAGFLILNWPPARIFMGDAGSNFLALTVLSVALSTVRGGQLNYTCWLILTSAFTADATVTLLRRIGNRESPWKAHRRHAYQQLARLLGHRPVTVIFGALTLFWAGPLAFCAQIWPHLHWLFVLTCYSPLVLASVLCGGGSAIEWTPNKR